MLTDRLNRLIGAGALGHLRYNERPERFEYHLTEKGRELGVALVALMQWGNRYFSDTPPRIARRRSDQSPVVVRIVEGRLGCRARRPRVRAQTGTLHPAAFGRCPHPAGTTTRPTDAGVKTSDLLTVLGMLLG